jgi:glutaredoxin 3
MCSPQVHVSGFAICDDANADAPALARGRGEIVGFHRMRCVRVYSTLVCPYCIRAKLLLRRRGIAFEVIDVTGDPEARRWLQETTGRKTVPQIFIDDEPIGGFEELRALDRSGELQRKLAA